MKKDKKPFLPPERKETLRHEIITLLKESQSFTAKDISAEVRIPEKEVYGHLEHIQKSLSKTGQHLHIKPAECLKLAVLFSQSVTGSKHREDVLCVIKNISRSLFFLLAVHSNSKTNHPKNAFSMDMDD